MSNEDIDISDIPPLKDEFFAMAKLRICQSPGKKRLPHPDTIFSNNF
ncbi:hypothetical protein [Anabaena sp. CA = ATCC 33047]|nr:hypothetical protein [Anabaena sp. CA = ATCC 33047]